MPTQPLEPVRSLWVGDALPAAQIACIRSFLRVGHPFELFVYNHVQGVPEGVTLRDADEIMPRHRVFTYGPASGGAAGGLGGFSNLFRYAMLLRLGGCWVDTDNFCLAPFPHDRVLISSERRKDGTTMPNCGVICCPPGHEFARFCLDRCENTDVNTLQFGMTGPALVAEAVEMLGLSECVTAPDVFCPIDWFHYKELTRVPQTEGQAVQAAPVLPSVSVGVHLWAEMWRRDGIHTPWPGPAGSLLEHLQNGTVTLAATRSAGASAASGTREQPDAIQKATR